MNILPKKRWHVRTKANIERVRRDEALAAKEEKERQRRILLAEQEARTDTLRRKHGHVQVRAEVEPSIEIATTKSDRHPNFFVEDSNISKDVSFNVEHEKEKKEEQEKWEKKVGILTYLGQSSQESGKEWYMSKPGDRINDFTEVEETDKQKKRRSFEDPLNEMKRHLNEKKQSKTDKEPANKTSQSSYSNSCSGKKSLEVLRAERLERERKERERASRVLAASKGLRVSTPPPNPNDRERRYNSQFNPHLARQNYNNNNNGWR